MQEKTIGNVSKITYRCHSKCLSIPFIELPNHKSYTDHNSHKTILDYDANIYAILGPYMNGTEQRDASMRFLVLDLSVSRNF